MKSYTEMLKYSSYHDRLKYLELGGGLGVSTFGHHRYINQNYYHSETWKNIRKQVILRDFGNDLAIDSRPILKLITIHHINPITIDDILEYNPNTSDLDNLICVSDSTHRLIHYGINSTPEVWKERKPNDTIPWK